MDSAHIPDDLALSTPDYTDDPVTEVSEVSTPVTASPLLSEQPLPSDPTTVTQKKKKKKKSKKSAKAREGAATAASKAQTQDDEDDSEDRPQVLCISRNKHWRYISSYHGPWLQLPIELLDSLLLLNADPIMYAASPPRSLYAFPTSPVSPSSRIRSFPNLDDISPPESPHALISSIAIPSGTGRPAPPPIDPGVLRSVTNIRKLIDHATDLSVRASSGISSIELSSMRSNPSYNGTSLAAAQSLGFNPLGTNNNGGRNAGMSANRVHRLRALAVQKLARAYMEDEIASSVMVMQGGSVFDDVAERVLRQDPNNADAKYVHFFHEKIPSSHRQLAESTATTVLDELISAYPHQLQYYRTRGIVHGFREEFGQAAKDFTHALKEARTQRRARIAHHNAQNESRSSKSKKRRGTGGGHGHTTGQAPSDGTSVPEGMIEGPDGEYLSLHPSVLPDAPEPIETQLLFFRGASYLQHAVHLIENAIINLEGVSKPTGIEGADLRLCCLENGRYGGVEIGNPDGPLGHRYSVKAKAYREVLAAKPFRDQVVGLIKKSLRDHEKFLSHFDGGETATALPEGDIAFQVEYAFQLSESIRPGNHNNPPPAQLPEIPPVLTTYHPLLVESHFSVLICHLLLADFANLLTQFAKTAVLVDGVEGYPIFLPPRSMGQAEFIEVLERLATGWKSGVQPHSLVTNHRGKARLTSSTAATTINHSINSMDLPKLITPSVSTSSTTSSISTISAFSPPPPVIVAPTPSSSSSSTFLTSAIAGIDLGGFPRSSASSSSSTPAPAPAYPPPTGYITNPSSKPNSPFIGGGGGGGGSTTIEPNYLSSSSSSTTLLHPDTTTFMDHYYSSPSYAASTSSASASVSRKSSSHALNSPCGVPSPSRSPLLYQPGGESSSKDKGKKSSYDNTDQEFCRPDSSHALDCARILLAPVVKRQKERALQAAADKAAGIKKPTPITIPLHGPRVEIILAWLGAVQFPELEGA